MALYAEFKQRLSWRPQHLSDKVPWRQPAAPGVILHKQTNALQRTYALRGPDLASETQEVQGALMLQANSVLKQLGGTWTVHSEAQRLPVTNYPLSAWPTPVARLIDDDRRRTLVDDPGSFETRYYLTLTWQPPSSMRSLAERLFVRGGPARPRDPEAQARRTLADFIRQADHVMYLLRGMLALARPLTDDETWTYLHSCVSDAWHPVKHPIFPLDMDMQLCDRPFRGGWYPQLGDHHLRLCSVMSFPDVSYAGVLKDLDHQAFPYRFCVRWIALEKEIQAGLLKRRQHQLLGEEKGVFARMGESFSKQQARIVNTAAVQKAEQADAARQEIGADLVAYGSFTGTVVVWDRAPEVAQDKLETVLQILDSHGFTSTPEREHATAAWLSTHPGNRLDSVRRTPQSSLVLAHLCPGLQSAWPGVSWDAHLDAPPWFSAHTEGLTKFDVVNHVMDVGHVLCLGPTGSGKSICANVMVAQWFRYPGAQVFWFDVGRSARCLTLCLGGHWYDLGSGQVGLQPLALIDDPVERAWAGEWLLTQLRTAGLTMTGSLQGYIARGLSRLAEVPRRQRTLSELLRVLTAISTDSEVAASKRKDWQERIQAEHMAARHALEPFTRRGPYGAILDADHDDLREGPLHTFEQETLLTMPRIVGPVLSLIFHRLEGRFDTRTPTFLPMDEAAITWAIPDYAEKGKEWMMTKRKKNVSLAFFTHSISQVFASALGPLLIESCPTWFMLPNPQARIPQMAAIYQQMGFNTEEIGIISEMRSQRDVYYRAEMLGKRRFSLPLSPLLLAMMGRNRQEDHEAMDRILGAHGPARFAEVWLAAQGFPGVLRPQEGDDAADEAMVHDRAGV